MMYYALLTPFELLRLIHLNRTLTDKGLEHRRLETRVQSFPLDGKAWLDVAIPVKNLSQKQ